MSDEAGDDEDLPAETIADRLEGAREDLADAETEADLDAAESTLSGIEADLDAAAFPEDEDEANDRREELEGTLSELREDLEDARGPYAEDVVETVESAAETVADTRWTGQGDDAVCAAVEAFAEAVGSAPGVDAPSTDRDGTDALVATLEDAAEAVESADLDPDADAEAVADLVAAADALVADLEDAEEWDDLEIREQLEAQGFFDVLGHYKDFPPEWSALKEHERRGNVDMIVLALENFDSDFMEEHCLGALTRMNDERAFEVMHKRASKRDKPGIRALGKMAAEDAVETLLEYVDTDADPGLQKVTFKALGEIGSEEATGPLADMLETDDDVVRPHAARALGLIGDTRAIDPLADALAEDDSDQVRAAAAWALRQIGTERALSTAADHADDRSYLVQSEAELAAETLGAEPPA